MRARQEMKCRSVGVDQKLGGGSEGSKRSPKGNMWSAKSVALPCMIERIDDCMIDSGK